MKRKIILRILLGATTFVLIGLLLLKVVVEPWVEKKINTSISEMGGNYTLKIEQINVSIFTSEIDLINISLLSKREVEDIPEIKAEIEIAELNGFNLIKTYFKKEIDIRDVTIYNFKFVGNVEFPAKAISYILSPIDIKVENLHLENFFVDVKSTTSQQTYLIKEGEIRMSEINILKLDTLTPNIFGEIEFEAAEIITVTADSLYTISALNINYANTANTLKASNFKVVPNHSEYVFASLNPFQKVRIEADITGITFHNFSIANYIKSRDIVCTYVEVENMEMLAFKDRRKTFNHIDRPTFQQMIYDHHGALNIDSLAILNGNIIYTEHSKNASSKGSISFNDVNTRIYNITNDTIYKSEKVYLELKAYALLMGESKINISLKARIFDSQNTFAINGTLSEMEASTLNPILEKSISTTINSGKINSIYFSFSANNSRASGNLKILYQDLHFTLLNREVDDDIAIMPQIKSFIANVIVLEANPMPGKEERPGTIDYERDPERFLFGYIFKSVLSGIKSSMTRNPDGMRLSLKK